MACLLILSHCLSVKKFLILVNSFFHEFCLMLYLKHHHHTQGYPGFHLCYLLRSFTLFHVEFRSVIHSESIFVKGVKSASKFIFFVQCFQYHLWEAIFAPLYCLCSLFQGSVGFIYVHLFPCSSFFSTDQPVYSFGNTILSWLLWFYSKPWSQIMSGLQFCSSV